MSEVSSAEIFVEILLLGCNNTGKQNLAEALIARNLPRGFSSRIHLKSTENGLRNAIIDSDFVVFMVQMTSELSFNFFINSLNFIPRTFPSRKICVVITEHITDEVAANFNIVQHTIQQRKYHTLIGGTKDAGALNTLADQLHKLVLMETGIHHRGFM